MTPVLQAIMGVGQLNLSVMPEVSLYLTIYFDVLR